MDEKELETIKENLKKVEEAMKVLEDRKKVVEQKRVYHGIHDYATVKEMQEGEKKINEYEETSSTLSDNIVDTLVNEKKEFY